MRPTVCLIAASRAEHLWKGQSKQVGHVTERYSDVILGLGPQSQTIMS